jgi:hypothetical protein
MFFFISKKKFPPKIYLQELLNLFCLLFSSPESAKNKNDMFYLQPERSCIPDSPVWYSNLALNHHQLDKMLQRVLMVREVQEHMLADAT